MQQPHRPDPARRVSISTVLKVQLGTSVLLTTTGFHHLVPCPVWLCRVCELSSRHITYSLVLCSINQMDGTRSVAYAAASLRKMTPSFYKNVTIKQKKNTVQRRAAEKTPHLSHHCLSRAMRLKDWCQPDAPSHSSTVCRDPQALHHI